MQKRPPHAIDTAAAQMKTNGAPWLSLVLLEYRDVPRIPQWQTSALPGAGWHQWGEAADCYCYRNGQMVQDGGDPCYRSYAEAAKKIGLTPGLISRTLTPGTYSCDRPPAQPTSTAGRRSTRS